MSLPDAWVDRIWTKLKLVYGHQFLSRWDGLAIADVKADWAHELRGFAQNPTAISYGLGHLPPGKPPTVLEFRAICNSPQSPAQGQPPALAYRTKTPQELAAERHIERIKRMRKAHPEYGEVVWAFALELKDREEPEWVSRRARELYLEVVANWRSTHTARDHHEQRAAA